MYNINNVGLGWSRFPLKMGRLFLTLLVLLPVVWCGDWRVTLADQCVLKGASAIIRCRYDYPFGSIVTSTAWSKAQYVLGSKKLFLLSSLYAASDHFIYVGNKRGNCDLQIRDVQLADQGEYFFSFWTTFNGWTSKSPAYLWVGELTTVVQPSTVTEGDRVRLTCESGCSDQTDIVWFRDGQRVPGPDFGAGRGDAGRYHCAVLGQETVRSEPVALSVQYAPEDVSVYLSPQRDIIQGSSVTLACRSNASPPVKPGGYSLYKNGQFISSGWLHTISNIQPGHRGHYHCEAWNNVSRGSFYRFNSTQVHLDVKYPPRNISVSVTPQHMVEGNSVNISCSSDANPAAHSFTWYRPTGSGSLLQVGSGPVLSLPSVKATDTGLYVCKATNRLGANNSTEVLLTLEIQQHDIQTLPVLAGIGVSLVVILVIALLLFWRKRRNVADKKQTLFDIRLSGRSSKSLAGEDPSDSVYANVHVAPSSAPPYSPAQENPDYQVITEHSRTSPLTTQSDVSTLSQAGASDEDEVTYSTVTIKPKTLRFPPQINDTRREKRSSTGGNNSSVVYATVVQSS